MRKAVVTTAAQPTKAEVPKKPGKGGMQYLAALDTEKKVEADNMKGEVKLRDLNFKVDPDFHTKFKMTATASGKSMKELLEECFAAWIHARRG
ncbi:hypothetical protein EV128_12564 [Rhizobium azibense]|nr:hypothetical protein EV128_12564 [Rhizobium azibense]